MLNGRNLPDKFDDFRAQDKQYLEWFTCNHSRAEYFQDNNFSPINHAPWTEETFFFFACKMMGFADDKIRFTFRVPADSEAHFVNSHPESA